MPPSQISAYSGFYQPGITKVYLVTTISNYLSPTRGELDAGLDVTRQTREINGFSYKADTIERKDYSSTFTPMIGGRQKADDSSLLVYAAQNGTDFRQTVTFGYVGNIVLLDGGDTTGFKMDVYPVQCIGVPKQRSDSDPLAILYQFAITKVPAENVAVP